MGRATGSSRELIKEQVVENRKEDWSIQVTGPGDDQQELKTRIIENRKWSITRN